MKNIIAIAALAATLSLAGCGISPDQGAKTLAAMGMTDIKIGGYAWFGCSEDDTFRSNFTAIGQNGQPVSGVLCGGMFKGVTVRFD